MVQICITRSNKQIPSTMATQHPDNASKAYWHECPPSSHNCEYISTAEEIEECYRSFADIGCEEYMWDWEGKFVDEAVVDRLFTNYLEYFKEQHLGRDKFLTFRIPNIWEEDTSRVARAFMAILTANEEAYRFHLNAPPIFEVILPQTDEASKLISMQDKFQKTAKHYCEIFEKDCSMEHFAIIPLIEGSQDLIGSKRILLNYIEQFNKKFDCSVDYIRPFIARSDPALASGFVPAVIAAKTAISEFYKFENETGIKVYPIIGPGSLYFRGGMSPRTIDEFLRGYKGVRTVTIQSAFRYDYPIDEVMDAVRRLNENLPKSSPVVYGKQELEDIRKTNKIFSRFYRDSVEAIASFIIDVASLLPAHRERISSSGDKGYGRLIGKEKKRFPRAVKFTGAFYSLGIPPEFIGTGRGIRELTENRKVQTLERFFPNLGDNLIAVGNYLNKKNLEILSAEVEGFHQIKEDVQIIEDYLGKKLGPHNEEGSQHGEETDRIVGLIMEKGNPKKNILNAAKIRKSLG